MKMKKRFLSVLLSLVMVLGLVPGMSLTAQAADTLSGSSTAEDPYLVSSTEDWNTFASNVTNGISYSGQVIRLTNDISVNTMVSESMEKPFMGTFDGGGHVITVNYSGSDTSLAPFQYVSGATFRNLTVNGTIDYSGNKYDNGIGGFVGCADGDIAFVSCRSSVTITCANNSACTGGFVGSEDNRYPDTAKRKNGTVSFNNCLFDGKINNPDNGNGVTGGFVGWCDWHEYNSNVKPNHHIVSIKNCLQIGTFTHENRVYAFARCRSENDSLTISNSYYKGNFGNSQGTQTSEVGENLRTKLGDGWHVNSEGVVLPKGTLQVATITNIPTAKSLTYNGQAQGLVTAGEATGGTMYYAVTKENTAPTDESLYTTSIPTATNAGTYYVWYKAVGDANHNDSAASYVTAKILEAPHPQTDASQTQTEASAPAAQTERITIPKKPAKVKTKARKNKVVVSWKRIKKNKKTKALRAMIKNVEVQYSTDPSFPKEATVTRIIKKNKTKLVLRGLQRKTLYYVRVRYVGADGVSNWKTKRVRTK